MNRSSSLSLVVLAAAAGAAAMYLFDPVQGKRRRALVRDKANSVAHHSAESINDTGRHLRNRLRGLRAETRRMLGVPEPHTSERAQMAAAAAARNSQEQVRT
jgi:gas vesicle protein